MTDKEKLSLAKVAFDQAQEQYKIKNYIGAEFNARLAVKLANVKQGEEADNAELLRLKAQVLLEMIKGRSTT